MIRRSAVAAIAAAGLLLAATPGYAADSAAGSSVDRLERYWKSAYGSKPASKASQRAEKATRSSASKRTRRTGPKARAAVAPNEAPSKLLAKARPDECYKGLGQPYMPMTGSACPADRQPKVNQAYVWGLTKSGDDLWFGTAPNVLCLVLGGYLGTTTPQENDAFACEFGSSTFASTAGLTVPPVLGDWRPSKLYRYRLAGNKLEDVGAQLGGVHLQRLNTTLGIRSAGSLGRVVFFAGPALDGTKLHIFAFDAVTGSFVSSAELPGYTNIRRWIAVDGHLYTAVGKVGGKGALLRWAGDPGDIGTAAAPSPSLFDFVEAGTLPTEGADLTEHEGRIYVSTWPSLGAAVPQVAGVYRSPVVPAGGLPASASELDEVWTVDEYEPDPVTAYTYGGGALASYDGKLVWGTMHVPGVAALAHFRFHGNPSGADEIIAAALGTWRAVAVFSTDNAEAADPDVDLLYGNTTLPVYTGTTWIIAPNKMLQTPKLGLAGFNDVFNNYTWAMGVTDRGLYVGTMDHSYLINKVLQPLLKTIAPPIVDDEEITTLLPAGTPGADLMRFKSLDTRAITISRAGVGNYTNYGVRTMVAEPERLYVGTANPMNLMTDRKDDVPEGGWELRVVGPEDEVPAPPTPAPQPIVRTEIVTQTVPGQVVVAQSESRTLCTPRRRKKFTMRLGLRMRQASASGLKNLRSVKATVGGRTLRTKRTKRGVDVSVDLTGVTGSRAKVRVELRLRKPITVTRGGKTHRTTKLVREYRYTVCS